MPKRKNGGGEYKKVKGSSGKSSPKRSTVSQPSQQVVVPPMPIAPDYRMMERMSMKSMQPEPMMSPEPMMERSKPLQPRRIHFDYEQQMAKPDTMPFRNTAIERLRD
tara:strand:+ start:151 stop:471 length:321 start_codon:yes stop_codon:yes gene_type:complete